MIWVHLNTSGKIFSEVIRNVTRDVKYYEHCEQLFLTIGFCYTIEALLEFFQMASRDANPTKNIPPWHNISLGDNRKKYLIASWISLFLTIYYHQKTAPQEMMKTSL